MNNKRFLMISSYAPSFLGFRAPLIEALQRSRLEVHLAAPESSIDESVRTQLENKGLRLHGFAMQRAGTNPLSDLRSLWSLWRLTRRLKPEYVLSYTIKPVIYGTLAAWLAGVPHRFALITGLGHAFQGPRNRLRIIAERLYGLSLEKTEKVFFQNPDDEQLFFELEILSTKKKSCVVNGSGVDLDLYPLRPLSDDRPEFLFMARLMIPKGIREYVNAARRVRIEHPEAVFRVLGGFDDNPESISERELNSWIKEKIIIYEGHVDDVRPIIEKTNVFVLPSYYPEGTPHSILEAMSMGRAIITTDSPGCRETVLESVNGFLVPIKSADALAEAMCRFARNTELIAAMGRESRNLAIDKFDVNKVNAIMLHEMKIS